MDINTEGWGKPRAARVWHYFMPGVDPAIPKFREHNAITSLCEKWSFEIYPSGKPAIHLWGSHPDTLSLYGMCKVCREGMPK
jgi:hypothetical protein